jgi:hypothetical protein
MCALLYSLAAMHPFPELCDLRRPSCTEKIVNILKDMDGWKKKEIDQMHKETAGT